jgi:hypothetical protein
MTAWTWLMIDQQDASSHYGPDFASHREAREDAWPFIRHLADALPKARDNALAWLDGTATDDTILIGPFIAAIISYDGTPEDKQFQAEMWLAEFQGIIERALEDDK